MTVLQLHHEHGNINLVASMGQKHLSTLLRICLDTAGDLEQEEDSDCHCEEEFGNR